MEKLSLLITLITNYLLVGTSLLASEAKPYTFPEMSDLWNSATPMGSPALCHF